MPLHKWGGIVILGVGVISVFQLTFGVPKLSDI